ncbi:nucleotidyltransferase domain-containing protein [Phycicoccus sonneratiae]|uniref:Nucleotidyltransferase domain-containing protein n=1 Tax=Phycicoccus sonneratiae TaxID=2807628 RepID=A0ABS2CMM2_9MICO|nr:nucleotidyltransferase domain-containing protein [Phycicoccus sonneraticus]MBM6401118.1 nucleotidyltransferase domain-containing protein [Phycicoccus sonneraticus]
MKTSPSALLPILRTPAVGELLARLFVHPQRGWALKDLAAAAQVSLPTTTREVTRMVRSGLLAEKRVGRTRQVRPNTDSLLFPPLRRLLLLTYGPVPVLEEELSAVAGIERAVVYGSWAERHAGVEGNEPNDVDVLVVGQPDLDDLYDVAERARQRLGRPVSIRNVSASRWNEPGSDPFLAGVTTGPLVTLGVGTER